MFYSKFFCDKNGDCGVNGLFAKKNGQDIAFTQMITNGTIISEDAKLLTKNEALDLFENEFSSQDYNQNFIEGIMESDDVLLKQWKIKDAKYYMISGYYLSDNNKWYFTGDRKIFLNKDQNFIKELAFMMNIPEDSYICDYKPQSVKTLVRVMK